jgi:CitMHS family citrate-Mg2+:H+ or citrate-Ca2+:H+ symporter
MEILTETKMTDGMAKYLVVIISTGGESYMTMVTAILSAPLSFLLSNDAFYFGVLPVLNQMAAIICWVSLLGTPIHTLSPLVAVLWLLVGMCEITIGDPQKKYIMDNRANDIKYGSSISDRAIFL